MRRVALTSLLPVLAACGGPPSPTGPGATPTPPATASERPRAPAAPQSMHAAATAPSAKPLSPLDAYKQGMARRILQQSAASIFEGVPPHLLRAVIVLEVAIDARGGVRRARILRAPPGERTLEQVALASLKRAAPFEPPPRPLLRRDGLVLAETWLFRDDGKFQIRSLAAPQPTLSDAD